MTKLGWPDLILEIDATTPVSEWLEPWAGIGKGLAGPRFLNRLGCFFLQRPEGPIEMLDVFYGQLEPIAASFAEFTMMVNDPSWQEVYLFSEYVHRLHQAGKIAAGQDCYALAPPPLFGGPDPWGEKKLSVESAMVMDVRVLQHLYAEHVAKAREADLE